MASILQEILPSKFTPGYRYFTCFVKDIFLPFNARWNTPVYVRKRNRWSDEAVGRENLRTASAMVLVFLVSSVECLQIALIILLSVSKMYNLFLYSHKNNALSGTHSYISSTKILQQMPICNKRIFIRKLRTTSFQDISQNIIIRKCLNIRTQFLKF